MRRTAIALSCCLALAVFIVGAAGEVLSHPALHTVATNPHGLPVEPVALRTANNSPVAAWVARGRAGGGVVLLLHGVRADRQSMLGRAAFLQQLGYSVVLIDLPGHGESTADHITFGVNEATGVTAALAYIKQEFPAEKIGVIGVSLGAASLVLSKPTPAPNAVVLESMYPTITDAVQDRLNMYGGSWAGFFAPVLLWQLPIRLGISVEQLRPIDDLPSLHAPVLIVSGTEDQHTRTIEIQKLYKVAAEPKELWLVDGAAHVDLHAFNPPAYESRVATFLAKHLRS